MSHGHWRVPNRSGSSAGFGDAPAGIADIPVRRPRSGEAPEVQQDNRAKEIREGWGGGGARMRLRFGTAGRGGSRSGPLG